MAGAGPRVCRHMAAPPASNAACSCCCALPICCGKQHACTAAAAACSATDVRAAFFNCAAYIHVPQSLDWVLCAGSIYYQPWHTWQLPAVAWTGVFVPHPHQLSCSHAQALHVHMRASQQSRLRHLAAQLLPLLVHAAEANVGWLCAPYLLRMLAGIVLRRGWSGHRSEYWYLPSCTVLPNGCLDCLVLF